ncbi:MAG: MoaD/ThiS family protein [Acidimicrobiaceae bacterium]|nr:MoaD/ThiS family protein [Acidimicrobiaceae bacterium]MXY12220.1 MoaD/ThiS family protein [Acidimicrobiaceae bacterium]MXZ64739.1 MoaD/ThiS family protein [Acidimicrobiaceae bacterium]MYA14676.1 MoaD/ThiS family protein [Acidimicrobiaceae bacterium]MYF32194.1 MoaD/ThiS family protein [Acidimicrobiaceae bacterium]
MIAGDRNRAEHPGRGCPPGRSASQPRRARSHRYHVAVAHLRLFASAREAAGKGRDTVPGATVREVLEEACGRYGHDFAGLLETCQVWCNGEPTAPNMPVGDDDEIAVLPPVSGG